MKFRDKKNAMLKEGLDDATIAEKLQVIDAEKELEIQLSN